MCGFVVSVRRPESDTAEFYNVVCDREEDAIRLVKAGFGFSDEPMRILRRLAAWEVTCFELQPLVAKRAGVTPPPAPARGLSRRLRAD